MTTGYEAAFYRHVERLAKAQERLADVETARYLRDRLKSLPMTDGDRPALVKRLANLDARIGR